MRRIAILSIKGGVGKSFVTANLGLALRDKGFKIGFGDYDLSGANLPSSLNIPEPFPYVGLDTAKEKILPVKINGYEIFSLCFRFGKAALLWESGIQKIELFNQQFEMWGTGRRALVKQMLTNVEFGELDYLLYDLPPQSGDEVLSFFEELEDIWGIIIVCQPTNLAVQDIERTLNMVEVRKIPLLGMVGNMVYAIAPKSKEEFFPFLDAGVDLEGFCSSRGIPYLASIPLTPKKELIDSKFQRMAEKVIAAAPVRIWQRSFKERLEIATAKGVVKGLFRD